MLREWINSIINQYVEISQKKYTRSNEWIDINVLSAVIFVALPEEFLYQCDEKKKLFSEIKSILQKDFVMHKEGGDINEVKVVGYWPPEEEINDIMICLEILYIFSGNWTDADEQTKFWDWLIRYPFLGKLQLMVNNYSMNCLKEAQENLGTFFILPKDINNIENGKELSEMKDLLDRYDIGNNGINYKEYYLLDKYCQMGLLYMKEMGKDVE